MRNGSQNLISRPTARALKPQCRCWLSCWPPETACLPACSIVVVAVDRELVSYSHSLSAHRFLSTCGRVQGRIPTTLPSNFLPVRFWWGSLRLGISSRTPVPHQIATHSSPPGIGSWGFPPHSQSISTADEQPADELGTMPPSRAMAKEMPSLLLGKLVHLH